MRHTERSGNSIRVQHLVSQEMLEMARVTASGVDHDASEAGPMPHLSAEAAGGGTRFKTECKKAA